MSRFALPVPLEQSVAAFEALATRLGKHAGRTPRSAQQYLRKKRLRGRGRRKTRRRQRYVIVNCGNGRFRPIVVPEDRLARIHGVVIMPEDVRLVADFHSWLEPHGAQHRFSERRQLRTRVMTPRPVATHS